MTILARSFVLSVFATVALSFAAPALAANPVLSANYQGSGSGSVQINVTNGNSFSQINLYTRQSSSLWTVVNNIGQTDSNGYFTMSLSMAGDGSSSPLQLYVIVGGLQSPTVSVYPNGGSGGCNYNCGNSYGLLLSQSNVSLNIGQSMAVTISNNNYNLSTGSGPYGNNYYYNSYYISSNFNSSVATASVSGTQLTVYGSQSGNTTIMVCSSGSACASLYVTVSGNSCGYYGCSNNLSLSQTSVSLTTGQSASVTANNSSGGSLYISSNTNSSVVSVSISGSVINLYALANGSSTINICANSSSQCGSLYVTVSGSGGSGSSVWFSQNTVTLTPGQNSSVTIYSNNYGGNYYVSSNSNSQAVTANVIGNSLNLHAQGNGSSTVTVCQSNSNSCGSIYVNANGGYNYGYGGSGLALSQTSLNLNQGQSASINIYGSGGYYISSNSNSNVASATLSANLVNIYAGQTGTTTIVICQNSYSGCANLYITISGYSYNNYYNNNNYNYNNGNYNNGGYSYYPGGSFQYPGGSSVLGTSAYANGQLISENGTVYIVYKNTKTGFASASIFTALGFKFGNVLQVGTTGLGDSGYTVRASQASHPWGSWIKNGTSTVYFVHESGLIPVPDWSTFLNNGGEASLIVPANSYDFGLPILTPMTSNDSRPR